MSEDMNSANTTYEIQCLTLDVYINNKKIIKVNLIVRNS